MKLWQTNTNSDKLIEKFTIGQDAVLDLELAKYDVIGSQAHAKMLQKINVITAEELEQLITALDKILASIQNGTFSIDESVEDIHSQVEFILTNELGDVGKKIHAGRSRNDQVLVDLKLYYRDKIDGFAEKLEAIAHAFVDKSEKHKEVLMPGYTHMQIGMVSSFGLWFGSFAEAIIDDLRLLKSTRKLVNQNPLGSAAGYGNSFPLDREETTDLLEFDNLCYNSMYAQMTRGKTELILVNSLSSICYTLNKFAMDVCLYCGQNHNFISLPDELTTGSSIMPHKKNPDVFELIRAKTSQLMALPNQITLICHNLISGYHRDFQQLKEVLFPSLHMLDEVLDICLYCIPKIKVNEDILEDEKYNYLFTVEDVNRLVKKGLSFREAYKKIKFDIGLGKYEPNTLLEHTHIGSIGNLSNTEILAKSSV